MRLYDVMTPLGGCGSIQEADSWFGSCSMFSRVNSSGKEGTVKNEQLKAEYDIVLHIHMSILSIHM